MHQYRRKSDSCIAKRFWEYCTPYLQIGGYIVMLTTIVSGLYICFGFVRDTQAYGPEISGLETKVDQDHDTVISMKQEIHDIHEWVKAIRSKRQ